MAVLQIARPPRGAQLTRKSWLTEAVYTMMQNNLTLQVAECPSELTVYGGRGQAARRHGIKLLTLKKVQQ